MEDKKRKILLWVIIIIGVIIVLGVVLYFIFRETGTAPENQTPTQTAISGVPTQEGASSTGFVSQVIPSATQIGERSAISSSKTATVSVQIASSPTLTDEEIKSDPILSKIPRSAIVAVTPYPGSGDLDWTRHTKYYIDETKLPQADQRTPCEMVGLSDNWDNPIEKFFCDSVNFFDIKITAALDEMECYLRIIQYNANLSTSIKGKYESGICKILDR